MPELSAHEIVLHKVFSSDYDFSIPDYQRPYAWDTSNALELLTDIDEARERGADEPYFLGSLVLVKEKDKPRAEVIDGQQRLTTITILLSLLRDRSSSEDVRNDLDEMVRQRAKVIRNIEARPRLRLRPKDQEFFASYVQEPGATLELLELDDDKLETDSQRAIKANAEALDQVLRSWDDEHKLALIDMLVNRTYLVAVSTSDLDSAHRIFGVLNARGMDLTPADIFKSQVIGAFRDDKTQSEKYAQKWEVAEEEIGREEFADLFLHIRMIESKQRARHGLLREFPEQVLDRYLPNQPAEFVDSVVVPYAKAFNQIRSQTYAAPTGADEINAWFRRLNQLDNNDWRHPALWALRAHAGDAGWLDEFFRKLERLASSMFIRRVWTTPRIARYIDVLKELEEAGKSHELSSFELSEEERAETRQIIDGDLYLGKKIRRFVLLRLDEVLANQPGVSYSHSTITVEHVLPQRPAVDSEWVRNFSEEDRETWTHRIGNLVLLNRSKNAEAQNYDFLTKKERYFTGSKGVSTFALTSQVLNMSEWTPETVARRQEKLVDALATEWRLD